MESDRGSVWIALAVLALAAAVVLTAQSPEAARPQQAPCEGPGQYTFGARDVPILLDTCSGRSWILSPGGASGPWWRAMVYGVAKVDESRDFLDFTPGMPGILAGPSEEGGDAERRQDIPPQSPPPVTEP